MKKVSEEKARAQASAEGIPNQKELIAQDNAKVEYLWTLLDKGTKEGLYSLEETLNAGLILRGMIKS